MNEYPNYIKNKLTKIIKEMSGTPENSVKNPSKDFTRNRKLSFESVINLLLSMEGNSIYKELLEHFKFNVSMTSTSAFVQQMEKILPSALEFLFKKFTNSYTRCKKFSGYRLLAADGSKLGIQYNPKDLSTHTKYDDNVRDFNELHLNALYDLCNKLYVDAYIQTPRKRNETSALVDMVDRPDISDAAIVIAGRGYENYNTIAHIQEKGWRYLIRIRDIHSNGIPSNLSLPCSKEFDKKISLKITRRQTNKIKANPKLYKFLPKSSRFDYLELKSHKFYPISFRVVRFEISKGNYETIITNLDNDNFTDKDIKKLYNMRWGIETSFRELKYAL